MTSVEVVGCPICFEDVDCVPLACCKAKCCEKCIQTWRKTTELCSFCRQPLVVAEEPTSWVHVVVFLIFVAVLWFVIPLLPLTEFLIPPKFPEVIKAFFTLYMVIFNHIAGMIRHIAFLFWASF